MEKYLIIKTDDFGNIVDVQSNMTIEDYLNATEEDETPPELS